MAGPMVAPGRQLAVLGCGNLLRGDDGVGPLAIRRLWSADLPPWVRLVDGGTAGMDAAFQIAGAQLAIIIDACCTGAEPGTVFRVPATELANLPAVSGVTSHSFRWDNAIAMGRWLLGEAFPDDVEVYLVEVASTIAGAVLSDQAIAGMRQVVDEIVERVRTGAPVLVPPAVTAPQPLGVFPLPTGYLLVPDGCDEVRDALLGGRLPGHWPAAAEPLWRAQRGDVDGATRLLRERVAATARVRGGLAAVDRYNLWVLDPEAGDPAVLRSELGQWGPLVDLVEFSIGRSDQPPTLPRAATTPPELAALVLAAQATAWGDVAPGRDVELLDQAVETARQVGAPLAALLLSAKGQAQAVHGDLEAAVATFDEALALLPERALPVARAELHVCAAEACQQLGADRPELMTAAVAHLNAAVQLVTVTEQPELYAQIHSGLATLYLTMPMAQASDSLRYAVAISSLRAALQVFTPERAPQQWASTQLNLANALVYVPSVRRADHLREAVELYEAVISSRASGDDVAGLARAMANQGNALAHLGDNEAAVTRLSSALELFESVGAVTEAAAVTELREQVLQHAVAAEVLS